MPYERDQILCDCLDKGSAFCLYERKPPAPMKCMAAGDWAHTLCSSGQCPGPWDKRCCQKPSQEPQPSDDDPLYDPIGFLRR